MAELGGANSHKLDASGPESRSCHPNGRQRAAVGARFRGGSDFWAERRQGGNVSAPLQGVVGTQSLTAAVPTVPDAMLRETATSSYPTRPSVPGPGGESALPAAPTPAG